MSDKQISLHTRIEQEAVKYANQFKYGVEYRKAAYVDSAASYIAKLQAAEEKAARYEKALKDFANKLNEACGQNGIITAGIHFIIDDMMMFEITPKTSEDE